MRSGKLYISVPINVSFNTIKATIKKDATFQYHYKCDVHGFYTPAFEWDNNSFFEYGTWRDGNESGQSYGGIKNGWKNCYYYKAENEDWRGCYQNIMVIFDGDITLEKKEKQETPITWKVNLCGNLEITKKDEDSKETLEGVLFKIKKGSMYVNASENKFSELTQTGGTTFATDNEGKIKVDNLPVGQDYYIEEVRTLEGYYWKGDENGIYIYAGDSTQGRIENGSIAIKPKKTKEVIVYNKSYGKLKIIKSDKDEPDKKLSGAIFAVKKGEKYVTVKPNEESKYEALKEDGWSNRIAETRVATTKFVTDENGCIEISNLPQGEYIIEEIQAPDGYEIITRTTNVTVSGTKAKERTEYLKTYLDNITNDIKYPEEGSANYEDEKNEIIDNLWYIIINTKREDDFNLFNKTEHDLQQAFKDSKNNKYNFISYIFDNYAKDELDYYEETINELNQESVLESWKFVATYLKDAYKNAKNKDISDIDLEMWLYKVQGGTATVIYNKKSTVNLKGYVWKELENMSPNGRHDMKESFLKGVTVKLVDNNGNTVKNKEGKECSIETGLDGMYIFENVERENLSNYHLETSYNGMSYQATNTEYKTASLKNGNVFSEIKRDEFNEKFTTIELNRAIGNNNKVTGLEYSNDAPNVSKLKLNERNNITIDSLPVTGVESKYTINAKSENIYIDKNNKSSIGYYDGKDTISGLNLGVYVREMPDIELEMNVVSVTIFVNGRSHKYDNAINKKDFENLTVYNADFENDDFKIEIEYKISLKDSSTEYYTNLNTKINQVNIVPIIGEKKFDTQKLTNFPINVKPYNAINKTRTTIETTTTLKFTKKDLNEQRCSIDDLNNITAYAEVVSYSTENGANVYGGVDKDSQPGNLDISRQNTYEDDSDNANVNCEKGIRTISGIVFEDNATGEIGAGKQRLGNGQYDENENKIKDVKVQLQIINGDKSETIKTTTTNDDGTFEITDFVAGRYKLVYTWGEDSKYNVVDYKSTIWSKDNKNSKNNNDNGKDKWYTKTEPRYSDALDDWYTRTKIDGDKPTTMDATTNDMEVGINDGKIENIDFGLIERPRQKVDIEKVVSSVKLSLANNAPIVEADVIEKEDGKRGFKEDVKGVQYIEPTKELPEGQILLTVDNELLQGSTLEINYSIKLSNSSEVDYKNENYYKYGEKGSDDELVKLEIKSIYDYLDKIMPLASDNKWEVCTSEYNKDENKETYAQANAAIKRWWDTQTTEDGTKIENSGYEMMQSHYFSELTEWNDSTEQELRKTISNSRQTLKYNIDNISLEPGKILETPLTLSTSKKLANTSEEIVIKNDTEVTKVIRENNYGRMVRLEQGKSFDSGEEVKIIPPTGQDKAYIVPTTVAIVSLGILLGGIILIKKKVLE